MEEENGTYIFHLSVPASKAQEEQVRDELAARKEMEKGQAARAIMPSARKEEVHVKLEGRTGKASARKEQAAHAAKEEVHVQVEGSKEQKVHTRMGLTGTKQVVVDKAFHGKRGERWAQKKRVLPMAGVNVSHFAGSSVAGCEVLQKKENNLCEIVLVGLRAHFLFLFQNL